MGQITIHRGSHQIGGCATEIKTENHRIIIDFGANLPDNQDDAAITDDALFNTVFENKSCDGVLFTHYHGDHVGLYKKISQNIPLYIGPTAKKFLEILTEKLDLNPNNTDKGLARVQGMKRYFASKRLNEFGDIHVTPFIVDHSALDAYMFLIEADGKRILFTGDFRDHGIVGANNRLEKTLNSRVGEVDILITEGTMLSRIEESKRNTVKTEEELGKRACELFKANKQSVILVSSTNLDSIMKFYHALPWGMDFVCDAYQAKIMLVAMEDKGKYYKKEYNPEMIHGKPRRLYIVGGMEGLGAEQNCYRAKFDILKRKGFTMLARENKPLFREKLETLDDPLIIYSKWTGYLKGKHQDTKITDFIGDHRMEILHTSGHAYVETIEKLIRLTKPKVIIPMHTECADSFDKIPEFAPYRDKVKILQDGEKFDF